MRVLLVDLGRVWRGGQNQALLLLRGLKQRGHAAELVASDGAALAERSQRAGITVHTTAARDRRWGAARLLWRLLRKQHFDIVHANEAHALTAAWLARAHRHASLVAARRVAFPLSHNRLSLARYRAAQRIIAVSHFAAQSLMESGIPSSAIQVVHDGVEIPSPASPESRHRARDHWSAARDMPLLGCVGYLLPEKGQELLLRAMPPIRARFPDCGLVLAGDGPERAKLTLLADELHLRGVVNFAGHVDDVSDVYQALDVFVFPSLAEPLGSSLLAAMSWGLPVVALASGGVTEIVRDGLNGLLVQEALPTAVAAAVTRLLTDHELARKLGEAARHTVAAKFSADRMVEATLAVFEPLTRRSAPSAG